MKLLPRKLSFFQALLLSLGFHLFALRCIEHYAIGTPQPLAPPKLALEKKEKSTLLKEFSFAAPSSLRKAPSSSVCREKEETLSFKNGEPSKKEGKKERAVHTPKLLDRAPPLQTSLRARVFTAPSLPARPHAAPFRQEPLPKPVVETPFAASSPPEIPFAVPSTPFFSDSPLLEKGLFFPIGPEQSRLRPFPSLKELGTARCSDQFEIELLLLPEEEEGKKLFALTLIAKNDLPLPRMPSCFTFLIDRSHSIQAERLRGSKNAVKKALSLLDSEDTFNLIAFDSRMEKFSPAPVAPTSENLKKAEKFLDEIALGSLFSPADLYKPLFTLIPFQPAKSELHTAILLTDGETLAKRSVQRALLTQWTEQNQGKVALFGIGIGGDPQLKTLDVAAAFNRGKLFHSDTIRGIKRKMLKLMQSVETPVAKNICCTAFSSSGEIALFSKISQSPHLYLDQPYILLGQADTLEDFTLLLQGQMKGGWLNVKKKISFQEAKEAPPSLKAEWALKRAYQIYEEHAHDASSEYLKEIEALLAPYDLQIAFK